VDAGFFKVLVENSSDAVVTIDEDSRVVFANRSVERVFGYEPDEIVGEELTKIMPERFHDKHLGAVGSYIETGERNLDWNDIELPGLRKDGTEVPLSITFEEHEYNGRRVFSGIMRDITERKRYEETLEKLQIEASRLHRTSTEKEVAERAAEAVSDVLGFPIAAVYLYDETSNRLDPVATTEAVEEVVGEPPSFGPGDGIAWEVFEDGERRVVEGFGEEAYNPDTDISGEIVAPLGDHGVLLVGQVDGEGFAQTDLDLVDILIPSILSALGRAEREEELESKNERLERLASVLSHDLREPLNTARAKLVLARNGDDEALEGLEEIHDRMEELIEDVLELTKQGRDIGEKETVDAGEVARAAWESVDAPDAALETVDTPRIEADPERLRTLFENLLGNSVRHGGEDSTVTVGSVGRRGFYVEDDGEGIPPEVRDDVFEYGFTTEKGGSGFGLGIVSSVAEAHGWEVSVEESDEGGARFVFDFKPKMEQKQTQK
jgi:PAS domain S-box-containing protein